MNGSGIVTILGMVGMAINDWLAILSIIGSLVLLVGSFFTNTSSAKFEQFAEWSIVGLVMGGIFQVCLFLSGNMPEQIGIIFRMPSGTVSLLFVLSFLLLVARFVITRNRPRTLPGLFRRHPANQRNQEIYPYRLRDDFLSPAETSFYHVLKSMVGENLTICPQVPLAALFFVAQGKQTQTYQNRIDRKRVDFVLCDPKTLKPRLAIELDDSSHQRPDRQERDAFVEQVFANARLPLVRVPAQSTYNTQELAAQFKKALQKDPSVGRENSAQVTSSGQSPTCPKCGVPMVRRVARQGSTPGKAFWGCPNYPRCREMIFDPATAAA